VGSTDVFSVWALSLGGLPMTKLPKEVNVMGHDYAIKLVAPEKMQYGKQKQAMILSSGAVGECEYPTRIIRLSTLVTGALLYYTLLHEIRHAYQFEAGWTQVLGSQAMELDCEQFTSLVVSLQKQGII
jgi:hypothetical protein